MARYKRTLSQEQMKFLIENNALSNQELAEKLSTTKEIIASYKSRARKAGIKIPHQIKFPASIAKEMNELAQGIGVSS